MSNRDPLAPDRAGLTDEDLATLGKDDPYDATDVTADPMVASDNAEPYLAPIDPPTVPGGRDNITMAQGFASSSEGDELGADLPTDDDTITERVGRALRNDAATSDLDLDVKTRDQIVYLRGPVPDLETADLAIEVAARIPTVLDVVDETIVEG